jgi:hypothetical protein
MKLYYLLLIFLLLLFCSKKVVKVEPVNTPVEAPVSPSTLSKPSVVHHELLDEKRIEPELESLKKEPSEEMAKERIIAPAVSGDANASAPSNEEILKRRIAEFETRKSVMVRDGGGIQRQLAQESFKTSGSGELDTELERLKSDLEHAEPAKEDAKPVKLFAISPNVSTVKAAAHDDNEEFAAYQEYCRNNQFPLNAKWKIDERYILKIVDKNEKPISGVKIGIEKQKKSIWNAVTPASGEIVMFPYMDFGSEYSSIRDYSLKIKGKNYAIEPGQDSYITVKLQTEPGVCSSIPLQICFLLDATGSMGDELQILKDVIFSIHSRLLAHPAHPEIEFSVVAYRDQGSKYVVKGFPFTKDIDTFQIQLESITAAGGGDEPEDLDTALQYVIDSLSWKDDAAKFTFIIADAPPHLDYNYKKDYMWAARKAREQAIMITPIGASGLKALGEFIFRQIAVLTNGEFVFLSYGEKGESDGAGTVSDPGKVSHHTGNNYNSRRLDDIVLDIITKELGYLVSDPKLVLENRKPEDESDFLELRLTDLIQQVFRSNLPLQGKTVALAPFYAADTMLKATSEFLWESALEKTIQVAPVKVLERVRLEELLKENALELTGLTIENPDPKIGKMLSADFMTFGKVQYIGAVRVCHMRLVDCQTGSVLSAARIKL